MPYNVLIDLLFKLVPLGFSAASDLIEQLEANGEDVPDEVWAALQDVGIENNADLQVAIQASRARHEDGENAE